MAASKSGTCVKKFYRFLPRARACFSSSIYHEQSRKVSASAVLKNDIASTKNGIPLLVENPIARYDDLYEFPREKNTRVTAQLTENLDTSVAKRQGGIMKTELQPLLIMPFDPVLGGKFVIHLLQKYKSYKTLVLVRARALAVELCLELEENGIPCKHAEALSDLEKGDSSTESGKVIVAFEDDADTWERLPVVNLFIQVHQPLNGLEFSLRTLKKSNFIGNDAKALMLYNNNDLGYLGKLQKHVSTSRLSTPSFYPSVNSLDKRSLQRASMEAMTPALVGRDHPLSDLEMPIPAKLPQYAIYRPLVPLSPQVAQRGRLCDHTRLYVRGGSGGQGSMKYAGLGGDGGNVVLECQEGATLQHFSIRENRRITGGHGIHFSSFSRKKKGTRGLDVIVPVPPGTTVTTDDGRLIEQLETVGSRLLVAQGGRGGSPATEDWVGGKGERCMIRLDLKLVADVGLVGFPNAGKSTLLSSVSRADAKSGDYPFTTIRPSIGMVEYPDSSQISVVDLPGLVEGARLNRGMGHLFLKHVERTKILALTVDVNGFQLSNNHPERTAFESLCLLLKEMVLYKQRLTYQPKVLIISKMDTDEAEKKYRELVENLQQLTERGGLLYALHNITPDNKFHQQRTHDEVSRLEDALSMRGIEFDDVIPVSSLSGEGLERMRERLRELVTIR